MSATPSLQSSSALKGWRARAWAWVLFLALFKGLIPHAALAAVTMAGDPALVWCAPGSPVVEGKAANAMAATAHACVCASAGDAALPPGLGAAPQAVSTADSLPSILHTAASPQRLLPPPARGPPTL